MTKLFSILAILFFSNNLFASGKISGQANFHENGKTRPVIGFQVYEPIMSKSVAFNSWLGYGESENEIDETAMWTVAKAQLDVRIGRWVVSPGTQYKWMPETGAKQSIGFVKASYDLW